MKADRQRKKRALPVRRGLLCGLSRCKIALVWLGVWMYPAVAVAAIPPRLAVTDEAAVSGSIFLEHTEGFVPPFLAAPRARSRAGVELRGMPADTVTLDARWSWINDRLPVEAGRNGPGDLRLHVHVELLERRSGMAGLGWGVKLPNAYDGAELGTDETDVSLFGTAGFRRERSHIVGFAGLEIMGDPNRFANQDDAAILGVELSTFSGHTRWTLRSGGTLATRRNPARMSADLGARWGCRVQSGLEGGIGLTDAAPDASFRAWVGLGAGCD
jgi:hypothetical protein